MAPKRVTCQQLIGYLKHTGKIMIINFFMCSDTVFLSGGNPYKVDMIKRFILVYRD